MQPKVKNLIVEAICFCLILLFMYAATSKLLDVERFSVQIGQSRLLTKYSEVLVWAVPLIEILISIMLAVSRFRLVALYASFTLMLLFTGYIVMVLTFDGRVPCSCGGVLEMLDWEAHLVFNGCFVLLSFVGIILYPSVDYPRVVGKST
jgi:uncharacterized membrane protein YphA (DoxX/SURF4 family)